jgi:ribonuclease Z
MSMGERRAVQYPERLSSRHPFRQWKQWKLPGTRLSLIGYSRANDKTFFMIPELKCCIDAGLYEGMMVNTVFLTHTHHDHSYDIEFLASEQDGRRIYAPAKAVGYLENYIRAKRELNFVAPFDPGLANAYVLRGVSGGDEILFGSKPQYQVKVVDCLHKVPCVGYCFSEKKSRLLPELLALRAEMLAGGQAKEFGRLVAEKRSAGIAVEEEHSSPLFAFLGDTHTEIFARNPWLFSYPIIITECTFLDDKERERALRVGHTLWSELRPVVAAHPEILFVLTHFSLRHSDREVIEFFQLEENFFENLVIWAHPDSVLPEQHQASTRGDAPRGEG